MSTEILHERQSQELQVQLRWERRSGRVFVIVRNRVTDEVIIVAPDRAHALDAFYHPFCYVAPVTAPPLAA